MVMRESGRVGPRERVLGAAILAMVADGCCAAFATARSHAGLGASLLSALEATAFLALPCAVLAVPIAWMLGRPETMALGRHVRAGLSGGREEHGGVALVWYALIVSVGVIVPAWLGIGVTDHLSARFAIILTTAFAMAWVFAASALVAVSARWVARPVLFASRHARWLPRPLDLFLAVVGVAALVLLLPLSHAITPAAAVAGFALGPWLELWLSPVRRVMRASSVAIVGIAALVTPTAAFALTHAPSSVQVALLYRAPYASLLVAAAHKAVDRDGDGYSPLLLGGDCNDRDPAIHPGAVDAPDNGVDENCSGEDTHAYRPLPEPPSPPFPDLPRHTNIVLLQLDATRPDHTSLAGYARPTTPSLDRFARTATWFSRAYTPAPTTRFAMAALFTGLDIDRIPQRRGPGINFTLLPNATTFAERLTADGYDAMGYTISYVLQHHISQGQGFRLWKTPWPVDDWESTYGKDAPLTTDAGIEFLRDKPEDGSRPYLLFLHYRCTHDPYIKHPEWDYGDSDVDRYDSAMAYCDQHIGRLFDAIDARADKDKTAVVVFSDHGELFGEHGITAHGNSLYEPDVRILLVARMPHGIVRKVDDPVMLTDVAPTVLELAGLPPDPASSAWSLVPYALTKTRTERPHRPLFLYADITRANVHYEARGVYDAPYKYIHDVNANVNMLFDLEHDPEELTNLSEALPRIRDRLAEQVDSWEAYGRSSGAQQPPAVIPHKWRPTTP
jgi:arylsulfatase A-like enzyme